MKLVNRFKGKAAGVFANTKAVTTLCLFLVLMAVVGSASAASLDAAKIGTEAEGIVNFIIALLNGWVGYLLALVAFFAGIFNYFKQRDLWGTLGAFGLAIMIMVVPPVLQGFFSGAV